MPALFLVIVQIQGFGPTEIENDNVWATLAVAQNEGAGASQAPTQQPCKNFNDSTEERSRAVYRAKNGATEKAFDALEWLVSPAMYSPMSRTRVNGVNGWSGITVIIGVILRFARSWVQWSCRGWNLSSPFPFFLEARRQIMMLVPVPSG